MAAGEPEDAVQMLLDWLRGRKFGSVTVEQALASLDRDAIDDVAVFLSLTLNDPVGKETWPISDVLALRHGVLDRASELGLETPIYVRLNPTTNSPQEDDASSSAL